MKPQRDIFISHVYSSNNNGDAAILSAQIAELQRVFPGAGITISTIDRVSRHATYEGLPVVEALMYGAVAPGRSRFNKLLFTAGMVSYTMLWAFVQRGLHVSLPLPKTWRPAIRALSKADMQVCVGGGYLRGKRGLTSTILLLLLAHQIWLARVLGKPVYLYAQSFGPYPTGTQIWLAKRAIRAASLVLVREAKSRQQLAALGIADEKVKKVPDSAFLFTAKPNKMVAQMVRPRGNKDTIVGITVRSWLDERRQAIYEKAIAELIGYIASKPQYRVVIIPQVTSVAQGDDDRVAGARIARRLHPSKNILFLQEQFSASDIRSVYAGLDYLVGTRFHSVIFSLLAGVPAVAIEYEHKTSGIMHDLGLDEWVIPIEDVTGTRITKLFDAVVREHEQYKQRLAQVVPVYKEKARTAADLIAQDFAAVTAPVE